MTALLEAELLKLRTTRTFLALVGVTAFTSLLIVVLVCLLTEPTEESVLRDVYTADTSSLFILVLAVVGITGEWRHRTIAGALLAAPGRVRFLGAKTLAFAAAGVVLSLAVSVSVAAVASVLLSLRDLPVPGLFEVVGQVARNAAIAALLGALGVAAGALARQQVVALVGVLVLSFAIEPAVLALAPTVGRFGPFVALPGSIQGVPPDELGLGEGLAPGFAVVVMLAWIAALVGRRRRAAPPPGCRLAAPTRPARARPLVHWTHVRGRWRGGSSFLGCGRAVGALLPPHRNVHPMDWGRPRKRGGEIGSDKDADAQEQSCREGRAWRGRGRRDRTGGGAGSPCGERHREVRAGRERPDDHRLGALRGLPRARQAGQRRARRSTGRPSRRSRTGASPGPTGRGTAPPRRRAAGRTTSP